MNGSYRHVPSSCSLITNDLLVEEIPPSTLVSSSSGIDCTTNSNSVSPSNSSTSTNSSASNSESTSILNFKEETRNNDSSEEYFEETPTGKPKIKITESLRRALNSSFRNKRNNKNKLDLCDEQQACKLLTKKNHLNLQTLNSQQSPINSTSSSKSQSPSKEESTVDVAVSFSCMNEKKKNENDENNGNVIIHRKKRDSFDTECLKSKTSVKHNSKKDYVIVALLLLINCLNFIDRLTIAGVLREIKEYYKINDALSGLLQTVFICSYMIFAPLFGYLGDRYNRKIIILFGISFWSIMTLAGSFVPPNYFWLFMIIRSLVGIGEASYSCVAPTIIGDLFTDELRTRMLALFYLAVPVGSGLGYIIGSNITYALGNWQWALRVTPPLGFVCIILLIVLVEEPKRGGAEGSFAPEKRTSLLNDTVYLLKNKSFMWTTMGFTFASFVLGGLSWWVPTFIDYAIHSINEKPNQVPLIFGVVTCFAGLIGVILSSLILPKFRSISKQADPLLCAIGSLIAVPILFIAILIPRAANMILYWFIVSIGIAAMCLCWTVVADITLYVVEPSRRSIASALNILICHLLGDAISPYIIGSISDRLMASLPDTYFNRFSSLQSALYAAPFFAALSFASYLFAAIYIDKDKKKVEEYIKVQKALYAAKHANAQLFEDNDSDLDKEQSDYSNENTTNNITNQQQILPASTTPTVNVVNASGYTNLNYNHSNSNTMANFNIEASSNV